MPPDESLLRISLTCAHDESMIDLLVAALARLQSDLPAAEIEAQ